MWKGNLLFVDLIFFVILMLHFFFSRQKTFGSLFYQCNIVTSKILIYVMPTWAYVIVYNNFNMVTWLLQVNAFRERRALALTLNDTKTAVNKLHRMVNVLVGILIAIIWLLILGIATSKFLVFISSQLLLVAFIFGNTCKTVFEAIIFLFVIHPFDVGDRCEIDGVQVRLRKIYELCFCSFVLSLP